MVKRVLITDGEQRTALALVRSLGSAGYVPIVASHEQRPLAAASRHCAHVVRTPDPLANPAAFADHVVDVCRRAQVDVLIPTSEASLLAVLPLRDRLVGITVPFADAAAFAAISDKEQLLKVASKLGIDVPRQILLRSADDSLDLDAVGLSFPVVIKPSHSVSRSNGRREKNSVLYASTSSELRQKLESLSVTAFPVLVQERIVGRGVGIFLLVWDDKIVGTFSHHRLREKPPSGGVSVYAESIPADTLLVAQSRKLLSAYGWRGVAMIEYKIQSRTNRPYLMEVNGRFWGSLQLAIDAGVDFPTLLVRAATKEHVEPVRSFRTGIRSRWWWGDVDHLLARLRHSDTELALAEDAPSKARTVLRFLTVRRGDSSEVFRWNDPGPFFRESINWFATL